MLDDFKTLTLYGDGRPSRRRSRKRDKGHDAQFAALWRWVNEDVEPEGPDPLATMGATLTALRAAEAGATLPLD